jgi:hypothetical protein
MSQPRKGRPRSRSPAGRRAGRLGERGLFDAPVLILFYISLLMAISTALLVGTPYIFRYIFGGLHLDVLLVHVPGMAGHPLYEHTLTTGLIPAGGLPIVEGVSETMGSLYGVFLTIALVAFIAALIFVGITYASEQFGLVSRGTAFQLLSESGLILILLFIFPFIYNGAAAVLNGLNEQVILHAVQNGRTVGAGEMIGKVAEASTTFGVTSGVLRVTQAIPGVNFVDLIAFLIQATATFSAMFSVLVVGVMRLLLFGVVAGAFPLFLVLRLIPPLRSIASSISGSIVGLLAGSMVVSILIRVAWGVLSKGLGSVETWAIGCGTLIASSMLLLSFTTAFGGLARAIQKGMVGPASAVMGGIIAAGGGAAAGAGLGGFMGLREGLHGLSTGIGLGGAAAGVGRAALAGGFAGARGGPLGALFAAPGAGKGAALAAQAKRVDLESIGGSTPFEKLMEYPGSKGFLNAFTDVSRSSLRMDQEARAGELIAEELNGNRMSKDTLERMLAVAAFDPQSKGQLRHALEVVKSKNYSQAELQNAFKDAYARWKSDPSLGESGANLILRSLHNRALGKAPFARLGEGAVLESIEGGG